MEEASQVPAPSWREPTYRQDLLLALVCHAGPPALHGFLFEKGHKPLRVKSVIQLVQRALLGGLGRLGHMVQIQLQGAYSREGFFDCGFLCHCQPGATLVLDSFMKNCPLLCLDLWT